MRKVRNFIAVALLLLNILQRYIEAGQIEVPCPEFCECDVYGNLKRAVCRERKLVSMELNIPSQAEILDLSDNQISELRDKIFLETELTNLKLLNLSHNKIHQIHFNAFIGLENLKSLDLSFNAIEYFTKSWFENLQSLEEFYLRGNKLMTINDEAPIDIPTLRILDISKCGITSLNAKTFSHLPNLQMLDISDNYIQRIKVDVLKKLPKLASLNADDNNFNCKDKFLINLRNYVKMKKIRFTDSCLDGFEPSFTVNYQVQKFAKMQMAEELEEESKKKPNLTRNSWIFDEDLDNKTKIIEVCSNNINNTNYESLLMEIIHLSPWLTILITFTYGALCGMVFLCAINLCIKTKEKSLHIPDTEMPDGSVSRNIPNPTPRRRDKNNFPRSTSALYSTIQSARRHMSLEDLEDDDYAETLVMNEFDLANSTPIVARKTLNTHNMF